MLFVIIYNADNTIFAQWSDINIKFGRYTFKTGYDSINYTTSLKIYDDDKSIYKRIFEGRVSDVKEYDLNNDGNKEILVDSYSGGAHCCTSLYLGKFTSGRFDFIDSIYWGNSFYEIKDLNNNGKQEIEGVNDMFAYAFTNYAASGLNILIYAFQDNRFVDVTKDFPKLVEENIGSYMEALKPFTTDTSFACPENDNEDTFNTDAGAVKALLAPIVADYYALGEVQKGYELVDSLYKCVDKNKFIGVLKNDFKLK